MNLIMLTKTYPFGTGETFIENEINVLSRYYKKIMIAACEVPENFTDLRPVPANVSTVVIFNKPKIVDAIKGVRWLGSKMPEITEEKRVCKSLAAKLFLGYFEEKSQRIFRKISNCDLESWLEEPFVLYSYWLFTTARVGVLISERYKPVYMFSRAHRYDLYEEKNRLNYLPYRNMLLKEYDNVFPCSRHGAEYLSEKHSKYADKVITSYLGTIDRGINQRSTDGVFRIVSCSRLAPVKRVDKIIDTLACLENDEMNFEWTHIGDGPEFARLEKKASNMLHNINFSFLGNLKNCDVMELYQSSNFDLFINVSSSEGLPVSIMEALSCGIPVIATDVGGTSEIVIDHVTGRLIPIDFEVQFLAKIIKEVSVSNSDEQRKLCRRYWEEHFQANRNYSGLCEFIEKHI